MNDVDPILACAVVAAVAFFAGMVLGTILHRR